MFRSVHQAQDTPLAIADPGHGDHGHGDWLFSTGLETINRGAGLIILFAASVAALNMALLVLSYLTGRPVNMWLAITQRHAAVSLDRIKLEFGRMVAFSLLILVAADVIETLVHPLHDVSLEALYKQGIVGVVRTGLAYFLGKEVHEIAHEIAEDHTVGNHGDAHALVPNTPATVETVGVLAAKAKTS